MISVLLPTRGRLKSLDESIDSLLRNASKIDGSMEILLAVDPDERELYKPSHYPDEVRIWMSSERFGYSQLHKYVNFLASRASG